MARTTFVLRDGVLVEKRFARPLQANASAFVHSDTMDAVAHPCTGEMMDSKSAFRRVTRENGCIEMGTEAPRYTPRAYDEGRLERDIVRAYDNPSSRAALSEGWAGLDSWRG